MGAQSIEERLLSAGLELLSDPVPHPSVPLMAASMLAACKPSDGRRDAWVDGAAWDEDWPAEETAELIRSANAGWFSLACESSLFGPRREFLFAVPLGEDGGEWRVARLLDDWDLVGKAAGAGWGSRPGCPEMTMSSLDGTVAMLITTYETGVSSIVVPRPWQSQTIQACMGSVIRETSKLPLSPDLPDWYPETAAAWTAYVQHHCG